MFTCYDYFEAFYDRINKQIKHGVLRLALDVSQVQINGSCNQFFKLFDLCSPKFQSTVHINNELSIKIIKNTQNKGVVITLILAGESKSIHLFDGEHSSKHDMICYGNLYTINRFCLFTLFNLLERSGDVEFENKFINYLSSLDPLEIKKIFIIFSQNITVFSEYNFNASLNYNYQFLKSIHWIDKATTLNLDSLAIDDCKKLISGLSIHEIPKEISQKHESVLVSDSSNSEIIYLYSNKINTNERRVDFGEKDFRMYPAEYFDRTSYIDTRNLPILKNDPAPEHWIPL